MKRALPALVLASVCACASAPAKPVTALQPTAASSAQRSSTPAPSKDCQPITLVQNQDGTLEVREPKEGEGIVGLVGDAITLAPGSGAAPTAKVIAEPPVALKDYHTPTFEALGPMNGSDTKILERYEQWSKSQPVAPATLKEFPTWMVTLGHWIIDIPLDQTFSSAELSAAASGIGWERIFATFAQLMPEQVASSSEAVPWRAHMWTAAGPQLQRAQEAYATCSEAKAAALTGFCRSRLEALRTLVGHSSSLETRSP